MKRTFAAPHPHKRCVGVTTLSDGSTAQCMHVGRGYIPRCHQHQQKMDNDYESDWLAHYAPKRPNAPKANQGGA